MKFINVPNTLEVSLDSAAKFAQTLLTNLAVDQRFTQVITTAFEDEFNPEKLERLRQAWATGDFNHLPEVEIRSSLEINHGAGAFSKNTNKIYLAEEFAVLHRNHTLAIADILLEETGHWVDAQINTEEAPGDEGAIFSALVRGKILDPHELQALKTENDHATVILDGEEIEIEQAIVDLSGEIEEVDISNLWADDATVPSAYKYSDWWGKTNSFLQIFEEAEDVFLQEDITISNPQDWDQLNNLDVIEAGLTVNSYFVFFKNPNPGNNVEVQATITFDPDESIIGFMGDPSLINPTNDLFVPYVARDLSGNGTLDMSVNGLDTVEILGEGNVLEVTMKNTSAVDPLRIITYSTPTPPEPDPFLIEAEDMTLRNYVIRDRNFASGGQLIRHRNNDREGKAITTWEGEAGIYDLSVIYHDESDGNGTAAVSIDGNLIENWTLDENPGSPNPRNNNRVERSLTQPVNLYPGSRIQLSGWRNGGENTWFDAIQLTPTASNIVRIEAEDMVLDNYIVRDRIFASGGQLIRHRNNDRAGTATTTWTGEAGTYNIQVVYHDENDGNAAAKLTVDGQLIESWSFDDNPRGINPNKRNRIERVLEGPVTLTPGSEIEFTGWRDGGENAWLDHIQFIPVEPIENTNPEAEDNNYTIAEDNTLTVSITAGVLSNDTDADGDDLTVTNYDNNSTAGGTVNVNGDGSFSYTPAVNFAGTDSFNYTVSDGNGGVDTATVTLEVTAENDTPEAVDDNYSLNENTALTFNPISNDSDLDGDTLTIDNYDSVSFYGGSISLNSDGSLTYIPVADFTGSDRFTYSISDGNGGIDTATINLTVNEVNGGETVSYAFSDKAIIARLDQDFVFTPEFEDTLEIMLLGDSITQGRVDKYEPEAEREGYRRFLWDALNDLGLDINFVGSESNGKGGFDQDHQGHSGWKIQDLANGKSTVPNSGIDNWISTEQAQPDLVLAMAGTNNAGSSGSNIANYLDDLIEKIFANPIFNGELIVSTIAPIHPNSSYYDSRLPNVIDYNALIPGVVESYANQGEEIHFVDIWSGDYAITENDMMPPPDDNGLHPSVNGYYNMAQTFYNAILDAVGVSESVNDVSNIIGSDFDDVIVANNSSNEIVGGIGADELTGNDGADLFIYQTPNNGEDIITDFDSTEGDQIQISAAGFGGGLVAGVSLSDSLAAATGVFVSGSNPQPVGNSANFLYDSTSGVLSVDIDGEGMENSVTLATLTGAPALAFNDLIIA